MAYGYIVSIRRVWVLKLIRVINKKVILDFILQWFFYFTYGFIRMVMDSKHTCREALSRPLASSSAITMYFVHEINRKISISNDLESLTSKISRSISKTL